MSNYSCQRYLHHSRSPCNARFDHQGRPRSNESAPAVSPPAQALPLYRPPAYLPIFPAVVSSHILHYLFSSIDLVAPQYPTKPQLAPSTLRPHASECGNDTQISRSAPVRRSSLLEIPYFRSSARE